MVREGDGLQVAEDSGGVGCYTHPASVRWTAPVSAGLPSDADARITCTRKTMIGGCIFAVSSLKNPRLMLTFRLSSKGPRISTSADLGSARFCRVGGFWSRFAVRGDDLRRDKLDPGSAVISGEYIGGREDSTGGTIGGEAGRMGHWGEAGEG